MTAAKAPNRPSVRGVRRGAPVPFDDALRGRLSANLAAFEVNRIDDPSLRAAAVCVCVVDDGREHAAVLLTLRPPRMGRHGDQYALPGGHVDPGECDDDAARRELAEEVGLEVGADAVLGRLDDVRTYSGFRIAPFVVWGGRAARLTPAPDEVARVFRIPFNELLSPEIPYIGPDPESGETVFSAPLPTLGHHVFAPTAAMLYQFREVAVLGNTVRIDDAGQPAFARR
jgi:8-oxo-dGTP pyrophosphatase MutT (NUDIX family)